MKANRTIPLESLGASASEIDEQKPPQSFSSFETRKITRRKEDRKDTANSELVTCTDCNKEVTKGNMSTHLKANTHLANVEKQKETLRKEAKSKRRALRKQNK